MGFTMVRNRPGRAEKRKIYSTEPIKTEKREAYEKRLKERGEERMLTNPEVVRRLDLNTHNEVVTDCFREVANKWIPTKTMGGPPHASPEVRWGIERQKAASKARKRTRVIIAKFRNKLPVENPEREEYKNLWKSVKAQTKRVNNLAPPTASLVPTPRKEWSVKELNSWRDTMLEAYKESRRLWHEYQQQRHQQDTGIEEVTNWDVKFGENPSRFIDRYIKNLPSSQLSAIRTPNDEIVTKSLQVKQRTADFFADKYKQEGERIKIVQPPNPSYISTALLGIHAPVRYEEVLLAVKKLKRRSAAGPDGIPPAIVKWGNEAAADIIWPLFSRVYEEATMPDLWRESLITPLPKNENGVAGDLKALRPIAIAPVFYRMYMWILSQRLVKAVDRNTMAWMQRAFRKKAGALDLVELVDALLEESSQTGEDLYIFLADVDKAYNNIIHQELMHVLAQVGLPKHWLKIIADSLTRMTAYVTTKYGKTRPIKLQKGIRQGCPLSPLLFALSVTYVLKEALKERRLDRFTIGEIECSSTGMYADDLSAWDSSLPRLQTIINTVEKALARLGLKFNAAKCKLIARRVGNIKNKWNVPPRVKVSGKDVVAIEADEAERLLGVFIQANSRWTVQRKVLLNKCHQIIKAIHLHKWANANKVRCYNWVVPRMCAYVTQIVNVDSELKAID